MRAWGSIFLTGVAYCGLAQAPTTTPPATDHRVQAIVQVQRDKMGANIVKISLLNPSYPAETLQRQVLAIGQGAGSGSRGLQISSTQTNPDDANSTTLHATFAVDGFVDPKGAWVRLAPIVKGLLGAPKPYELRNFIVYFDYETPTAQDLGSYSSPAVEIHRELVPPSLEYSVSLKTQDPALVNVPDFAEKKVLSSTTGPKEKMDWLAVITVGVASLAAGALVYCLFLLKPSSKKGIRR